MGVAHLAHRGRPLLAVLALVLLAACSPYADAERDVAAGGRGLAKLNPAPKQAYELVLKNAGCLPWDTVGRRTVNEVRNGAGAWGRHAPGDLLAGLTPAAPPKDTDHDGMPDFWERAKGLNSSDSTDQVKVLTSGYTAIEEYGNLLAQRLIETGGNFPARGDVNANGTVNIFDLLELIGALREDSPGWAADLNLDGRVNLFDLLELLRLLAGMD